MVDRKQTKTIGEYWVAAELARREWAPALTRDGLERTDILAAGTNTGATIQVQVKTAMLAGPKPAVRWILGAKAQQPSMAPNEWFVLVAVPAQVDQTPRPFIVPRDHIAAAAWISHMEWLTDPSVPPGRRNGRVEHSRVGMEVFARYENQWDQLKNETSQAPILLPTHYHDLAQTQRVGLPPDHPWHDSMPDPWE